MIDYDLDNEYLKNIKTEKDAIDMLKKHSFDSFVFSIRTGELNYAISKEMGFSEEEAILYYECGLFHDIGKLGMSTFLINFPGDYTKEMFEEMKKHTVGGSEILKRIHAHQHYIDTAKYHHCNYDGTGYMYNLKGDEIPFPARLTRISDSADAYLSKRSYKNSFNGFHVFDDLNQYSGTFYDPNILRYFRIVHEKIIKLLNTPNISQNDYMKALNEIYNTHSISKKWV